jgi:hypothetical protein
MNTKQLSQLSNLYLMETSRAVHTCIRLLTEDYLHISENLESEIKALNKAAKQIEQEIENRDL